jgi:hypothetical protein
MKMFKLGLMTLTLLFLGLYTNVSAQQQAPIVFANNSNETTFVGTLTRTISTALNDFNGDMNTVYQTFVNDYANALNHQIIQGLIQVHQGNVRMPSNNTFSAPMAIREAILRKLIQSVAAAIIQISQAKNNLKQFFTDQQHCTDLMQQLRQRTPQPFVQAVAYSNNFWTRWAQNIYGALSAQTQSQQNQYTSALLQNGGYDPDVEKRLVQHEKSLKRIWQLLFAVGVAIVQFGPDLLRCLWTDDVCNGVGNWKQEAALYTVITGTGNALWYLISFLRKRKSELKTV